MNFSKLKDLPVSFTVNKQYDTKDTRFLDITIDVLHTGQNFNGSIFNKEIVDENIDSIKNTPILGYIKLNDDGSADDFKAHEYKVVKKDNKYQYVYAGYAYGTIPESCNPRWINKVSSDGVMREYLQVDALIWTKFDKAVDIFNRDIIKGQSMELAEDSMQGTEDENGIFTFTEFKFDGCCILSTSDPRIQPAMIDSVAVANFSTENIFAEIKTKLDEYYQTIKFEDNKIFSKINEKKEENKNLNKEQTETLFSKYNLKIEDIDFSIENMNVDEIEEKLKDFVASKDSKNAESQTDDKSTASTDFSLTANQFEDELRNQLRTEMFKDNWGDEYPRYCYYDYKDTEVYAFDRLENYNIVGFAFIIAGDSVTIDFTSRKRMKIEIVDFEGTDAEPTPEELGSDPMFSIIPKDCIEYEAKSKVKEVEDKFTAEIADIQGKFNTVSNEYETVKPELVRLQEFEKKILADQRTESEDAIFAQFTELNDNEDFKTLKENAKNYDLEALTDKCFSIKGRLNSNFSLNASKENKTVKIAVDVNDSENESSEPYHGLLKKYSKNK